MEIFIGNICYILNNKKIKNNCITIYIIMNMLFIKHLCRMYGF